MIFLIILRKKFNTKDYCIKFYKKTRQFIGHIVRKARIFFYRKEHSVIRILRRVHFFGIAYFFRQNGGFLIITIIATMIVFGNIAAKNDIHDMFLIWRWSSQEMHVKKTPVEDGSIALDGGFIDTLQSRVASSKEKEAASKQSDLLVLHTDEDSLIANESIIPPRREGASDPDNEGDVVLYTVRSGDTVSTIAQKHGITVSTLYWANEIDNIDDIKPGDVLFILPTSGLKYVVKSGDSIDKIAKEFKVKKEKIISYNQLPANGELEKGKEIIIPDAKKEIPKPEPEPLLSPQTYVATGTGSTNLGSSIVKNTAKKRVAGNRFPYGYCTYYVANKRTVTWRGNAGAWLYNARAQGYKTGKKPRAGAIVVTTEDARYGHVAYVESVGKNTITVTEMNYKGFAVVNTRTLSQNARVIRGYIY